MPEDGEAIGIVVLRDGEGENYLPPCAALEQARVPACHRAALEETLVDADVSGVGYNISGLSGIGLVEGRPFGDAYEIVSPRDAASGQATGKRQPMPIRLRVAHDRPALSRKILRR